MFKCTILWWVTPSKSPKLDPASVGLDFSTSSTKRICNSNSNLFPLPKDWPLFTLLVTYKNGNSSNWAEGWPVLQIPSWHGPNLTGGYRACSAPQSQTALCPVLLQHHKETKTHNTCSGLHFIQWTRKEQVTMSVLQISSIESCCTKHHLFQSPN